MNLKGLQQLREQSRQFAEDNPLLCEMWHEYTQDNEPSLTGFTDYLEQNIGSLLIWKMQDTDMPFSEWQEGRLD